MTINDFLNQDIEDFDSISNYYINYLKELSENDYSFVHYINLTGFSQKFIISVNRYHYLTNEVQSDFNERIDNLLRDIKIYHRSQKVSKFFKFFLPIETKLFTANRSFEKVYANSLDFINKIIEIRGYQKDNLTINDFYEPKNTNKEKVKELIKEAIDLINEDDSLTESTRKQIVDYLDSTLKSLNKESINWTDVLGKIKETILVLGALGSFIGGVTPLMMAKEKLEESDNIIQKTSINYNYKTINNTFQIKNIEQLKLIQDHNSIFLIDAQKNKL